MLIDAHAHLCDPAFDLDRAAVLERARAAGVEAIVAVGETLADAQRNLALQWEFDLVLPALGLYPTHLDLAQADAIAALLRAERPRIAAIGEVGLDHWAVPEGEGRLVQRAVFLRFVALAAELDLPLNVHSRSAGRATIELLLAHGARRVLMHAFDGRAQSALPGVEAGFFFSVPPSVVRSPQKQKLVRRLPLEHLLVETDSPVLGPVPGERNEPANVQISLRAIAEAKDLPLARVQEQVGENARRWLSPG